MKITVKTSLGKFYCVLAALRNQTIKNDEDFNKVLTSMDYTKDEFAHAFEAEREDGNLSPHDSYLVNNDSFQTLGKDMFKPERLERAKSFKYSRLPINVEAQVRVCAAIDKLLTPRELEEDKQLQEEEKIEKENSVIKIVNETITSLNSLNSILSESADKDIKEQVQIANSAILKLSTLLNAKLLKA